MLGLLPATGPAAAQSPPSFDGPHRVVLRDAETETLLRTYANPLFRAAGVEPNLVRPNLIHIVLIRDAAINSFVSTGNRMLVRTVRLLAAALLAAVILAAPAALAQSPDSFTPRQREEIVDILRHALKSDPSLLRDAIAALQLDEAQKQDAATRAVITGMADALLHKPGDPVAGNPNGDVTVVEFYDVRCPYCRSMLSVDAEMLRRDRNIRLVYKDIPILGPGSVVAARAVLAAQRHGGFQRLHDALMAGTPNIDQEVVHAAAQRLGLDWDKLQRDMTDPAIQTRIDANLQMAHALQIDGTPAYVIGDQLLSGAVELAELQGAVAAARRK